MAWLCLEPFGLGSDGDAIDVDGVRLAMTEQDDSMTLSEVSGTFHVEDFAADGQ